VGARLRIGKKQSKLLFVVAWEKNAEHEAQHIRYHRNIMKNLLCNHHLNV
jgi:hypothetical protein